jgi:hypothetical protein
MAQGHIVLTLDPPGVGAVATQGRVVAVGALNTEDTYDEYTDFDTSSVEKRVGFIKRAYARGDLEITIDSMLDPTVFTGMGWAVTLAQQYPASATPPDTGFLWTADLALIQCTPVLNARGAASQTKISVKPYVTTITDPPFEIDVAADYSA